MACAATGACIPVWSIVKEQNFLLCEECKTAVSSIVLCAQKVPVDAKTIWWLIFKLDSLVNFSVCEVYL